MTRDNPQSNFAFIAAGKTYQALGMHEEAMRALDKALAMHPDVMTYLNRADVRPYTDLEGRLSDVDAALKLEPNDVDALMQKAYNLVLKGDYAQALRLYDQSATIDVNPDNRAIPMGRAVALYKSGRQAEAEKVLASVRARAKSARDFQSLCWSEARWNMFVQTAVKDCEQAQKLDPKTPTDDQGLALLRAGRIDDAIASFGKSIAASRDAFSYMGRAIAYQRQGKLAQAAADRREALKLRPDEESILAEYGLKFDAPSGPEASQAATPAAN
jgi:tetratricopeptide (TPR) repeat protein